MMTVMTSLNFDNFSHVNKKNFSKKSQQYNLHLRSYVAELERKFAVLSIEMMR